MAGDWLSGLTIRESPKLAITGTADASATITPELQAFIYGIGGPQLSLTTGLQLNASQSQRPYWWTLDAPLEVDASLVAPKLGLNQGPTLHLYGPKSIRLDHASGPFSGPASVTMTNPGNQTSTVGTQVNLQIDATDTDGGALTYSYTGLPAGLQIDSQTGLIYGVPTTPGSSSVTVTATDASGATDSTTFNWTIAAFETSNSSFALLHGSSYGSSAFSADTSTVAWPNDTGTGVVIHDTATGAEHTIDVGAFSISLSPDGSNLTTLSSAQDRDGFGGEGRGSCLASLPPSRRPRPARRHTRRRAGRRHPWSAARAAARSSSRS